MGNLNDQEPKTDDENAAADEERATPATGLAARRAKLENTKAYRDLQVELAGRVCENCGQKGPYDVVSSPKPVDGQKKVRYLQCLACGYQAKMASDK